MQIIAIGQDGVQVGCDHVEMIALVRKQGLLDDLAAQCLLQSFPEILWRRNADGQTWTLKLAEAHIDWLLDQQCVHPMDLGLVQLLLINLERVEA